MRDVIRNWAGLAPMARLTNQHTSQDFCLHTIVEVGLIFQFTNLYLKVQQPRGKVLVALSTWKCCGHFFDFDEVTFGTDGDGRMATCKQSVWRHEHIA